MLDIPIQPDYEALLRDLRREGTPERVHFMELFWDAEIGQAIWQRYGLGEGLDPGDPDYPRRRSIRLHRFLGYDDIPVGLGNAGFPHDNFARTSDTADLARAGGRNWLDEHTGPIATWEDFERYPWPDPSAADTSDIEWHAKHVPDDMCLRADCHSIFEYVTWLMGYERLCFALHDAPDLVDAMFERVGATCLAYCELLAGFERIEILFGGDDMGHRTGAMISAQTLRDKSLVWHKRNAEVAHAHGKLYLLHACGNLEELMPALIEDVKLDGKHSFEDVIEPVTVAKRRWGDRLALIGGIDVDFLCRADEAAVRRRVRDTLEVCLPGGGYCLGTGNSVTNYIPLRNYLAMLDEGRRFV